MAFMMREPTDEECQASAFLGEDERHAYFATWYPQMGGYCGKAVVQVPKNGEDWGCFDAWVWHDGQFPFEGEEDDWGNPGQGPCHLHHCGAAQFIRFGLSVRRFYREVNGPAEGK